MCIDVCSAPVYNQRSYQASRRKVVIFGFFGGSDKDSPLPRPRLFSDYNVANACMSPQMYFVLRTRRNAQVYLSVLTMVQDNSSL